MKDDDFKSLNQTSRIEYILLRHELKRKYSYLSIPKISFLCIGLVMLIALVGSFYYIITGDTSLYIKNMAILTARIIVFLSIASVIIKIILIFKEKHSIERLDKEFLERLK